MAKPQTAIVVSHTHWDREWYLTFQAFRLRLVDMIDHLLDLLSRDAEFAHFMLDGQTILVDDYLAVRPERAEEIAAHVRAGRISLGPWYVQPDVFLVSGEALIRNLMAGHRGASPFGRPMQVGYLPDNFGQINQLPQIAQGWGLKAVVITRGVPDYPCEFMWDGPGPKSGRLTDNTTNGLTASTTKHKQAAPADGVRILAIHLRSSYANALYLRASPTLTARIQTETNNLAPHSATAYRLLLNGIDHHLPEATVPQAIRYLGDSLPNINVVHGSLEQYVDAVLDARPMLEHHAGEMRSSQLHQLLPGVLSTRMPIKQRNAHSQTLLERWVEPLTAWAALLGQPDRRPLVWQAWRYLLQNQAHDSICGCGIDAVHRDMAPRFDWADQIAEELIDTSVQAVCTDAIRSPGSPRYLVAVLNSESGPRTDVVQTTIELPDEHTSVELINTEDGQLVPAEISGIEEREPFSFSVSSAVALWLLEELASGELVNRRVRTMSVRQDGLNVYLDFVAGDVGTPDPRELDAFIHQVEDLAVTLEDATFHFRMRFPPRAKLRFIAPVVPPMGFRLLATAPTACDLPTIPPIDPALGVSGRSKPPFLGASSTAALPCSLTISNDCFRVQADPTDGSLEVFDARTGGTYSGLNRFIDEGEAGDEYNHCPPLDEDLRVDHPLAPPSIHSERGKLGQTLDIQMVYRVPAEISHDRRTRSQATQELPIHTRVTLYNDVRRIDIETQVHNQARDHRLRVLFPTGVVSPMAWADTAFDVISRPTGAPPAHADWARSDREQPTSTWPQQCFVDVSDRTRGLAVASRGLPEYEVLAEPSGNTIALTLLRCVGWLSRDDLPTRRGNAGPAIPTPEAQCPGMHSFHYAIVPHLEGWEKAFPEGRQFAVPMRAALICTSMPAIIARSLVAAHPEQIIVSAVKQPEQGEGLIVRVFNPLPYTVDLRLDLGLGFAGASLVNLREEPQAGGPLAITHPLPGCSCLEMKLPPKRIQTIHFR